MRIAFYRLVNSAHFLTNVRRSDGFLFALVDLNEMEMLRQQRGEGLGQVMRVAQFYRIALAPLRGGGWAILNSSVDFFAGIIPDWESPRCGHGLVAAGIAVQTLTTAILYPIKGRTWSELNQHRNSYLVGAMFARSSSGGSWDFGLTCSSRFPSLDGPMSFWVVIDSSARCWPDPWSASKKSS